MCILRNFLLHFFLFCSYFIAHFVWFLYFFAFRAFWIFFIWKWHFPDILVWFPKAEISHFGEFCLFFLSDFAHSCASMHSLDIFPKARWAHYPPPRLMIMFYFVFSVHFFVQASEMAWYELPVPGICFPKERCARHSLSGLPILFISFLPDLWIRHPRWHQHHLQRCGQAVCPLADYL